MQQYDAMMGRSEGRRFRVIIHIRVEYEQYFVILLYGRADHKVNDGITFGEQSKIHESKTF